MRYQLEQVSFGNPDHQAIFMLPGLAMPTGVWVYPSQNCWRLWRPGLKYWEQSF